MNRPFSSLFQCAGPYGSLPMALVNTYCMFIENVTGLQVLTVCGCLLFLFHPRMFCHPPVYSYTGSQRFVFNFLNSHQPLSEKNKKLWAAAPILHAHANRLHTAQSSLNSKSHKNAISEVSGWKEEPTI